MKPVRLQWKVTNEQDGLLLRDFLLREKGISRRTLTAIKFEGGNILVNNSIVTVRHTLEYKDVVEVILPWQEKKEGIVAEELDLDIIYEDEHILVINKKPFMASIPSRDHPNGTLANAVLHYYKKNQLDYTIHVVNRLDKDTSGLLIVAKHRYAHHLFSQLQKEGKIHRRYEAVIHGEIKEENKIIIAPIGRKDDSIIEREVRSDGQYAETHYQVLKRFLNKTYLSIKLVTGRTHQIRVHLSSLGFPLLGDDLYGGQRSEINRQALHSRELSFFHPFLEKEMHFQTDLPEDMKRLLF